jgi:hypothetical protein
MRHHVSPETPDRRRAPRARVEFNARPAGTATLIEPDGTRWRICDCVIRRGKLERVYLESDKALYRLFLGPDGQQLGYYRRRFEPFALSPEECMRQLAAAKELPAAMRFDGL